MLTANPTIQPLAANDGGMVGEREREEGERPSLPSLFYAIVRSS